MNGINKIKIIDSTLREGMQAPGTLFGINETIEIAENLVEIGVDMIECGHPSASQNEFDRVYRLAKRGLDIELLSHARALPSDIDRVNDTGVDWVGIFLGLNEVSLTHKYNGISKEEGLERLAVALDYAKSKEMKIRFTLEDASRTDFGTISSVIDLVALYKIDRFCFSDTVGICTPLNISSIIKRVKKLLTMELETHMHNDRGYANANSLLSVEAGATWISSSVNGIGERCGITDTAEILVNLAFEGFRDEPNIQQLQKIEKLVSAHSRIQNYLQKPITGETAFQHTSDLHKKAVKKSPASYEWIPNPHSLDIEEK